MEIEFKKKDIKVSLLSFVLIFLVSPLPTGKSYPNLVYEARRYKNSLEFTLLASSQKLRADNGSSFLGKKCQMSEARPPQLSQKLFSLTMEVGSWMLCTSAE